MADPRKVRIAALDIATTCGWAIGYLGEPPAAGSIRFGSVGRDPAHKIFAAALDWAADFFTGDKPDSLVIEAMLPPTAMHNKTSRQTRDRLAGLHGIMLASAHKYGIGEIVTVDVGTIRAHFIGDRTLARDAAKRETVRRCKQLGWIVNDNDAADACAVWSYACSLLDPKWGIQLSPLFNRAVAL